MQGQIDEQNPTNDYIKLLYIRSMYQSFIVLNAI